MKVALCLHGYFNSFTDPNSKGDMGFEYIKKHILDVVDTDVFIHSWQPDLQQKFNTLYNPIKTKFEEQINFLSFINENELDLLKDPPRTPQTILSHFYSIQESVRLMYESGNIYNFVIRSRFDLGQINRSTSTHNVECINFELSNPIDRINMAWWPDRWMLNEGPPDCWFYSGYETMRPFSNIFDSVQSYMKLGSAHREFIKQILGEANISNASVLYKKFFEDNNLWENRNTLFCKRN